MDLRDIIEEHGIISPQFAKAASKAAKAPSFPKILHFNAHRAQLFVAAILQDPVSHGAVLVDRKDGNISCLNKGKAAQSLSLALSKSDAFKVTGE